MTLWKEVSKQHYLGIKNKKEGEVMDGIATIRELIKEKKLIDQKGTWSEGSQTYLEELKKELVEVEEELLLDRQCYLEDELGDVFWDYMNWLYNLEQEGKINLTEVFKRCAKKYTERINGLKSGQTWQDVKTEQKIVLAQEHQKEHNKK